MVLDLDARHAPLSNMNDLMALRLCNDSSTTEQRLDDLEKLYETLRYRTERDAQHILSLIRAGDSISEVVRDIDTGDLLLNMCHVPGQPE